MLGEKREIHVRGSLARALPASITVLSVSKSNTSESMYITLLDSKRRYSSFRISKHPVYSGFLTIPTFSAKLVENIDQDIANYFETAPWTSFRYEDFFVLMLIKLAPNHSSMFGIDDTYKTFSRETQNMIFYQSRSRKRRHIVEDHILSDKMNNVFERLYSSDLISHVTRQDILRVYVSNAGQRLLDLYTGEYGEMFRLDYEKVQWHRLDFPEGFLFSDEL